MFATLVLAGAVARGVEVEAPVNLRKDGHLAYTADEHGNQVPDFSTAGYGGGGVKLPVIPSRVRVTPHSGDNTARIQAALDYITRLTPDASGMRGAVELAAGRYDIAGQLLIHASGVVLRGAGSGPNQTVLVATGQDRRTLIEVHGTHDRSTNGAPHAITTQYVAVGSTTLQVAAADASTFRAGMSVLVERPSPAAWIKAVGMNIAPGPTFYSWKPGTLNVSWDRVIAAVDGPTLTLDSPITTALDAKFGGGTVSLYTWPGRIEQVGVEDLRCESAFAANNPVDEQHAWMAIDLDNAQNAWVRNVTGVHFVSSVVQLGAGCKWVTVEDCTSLEPISELGGYRRHSFHTDGQLTLFVRCRAEEGREDFTVGYLSTGPNVFLDCRTVNSHGFSGSIGSWASGALFDGDYLDGATLRLDNLETWNQGVGWSLVNSMIWQTSAARIICREPPGANNWAVAPWGEFMGDGSWSRANSFVKPESLYRAQLAERRGATVLDNLLDAPAERLGGAAPTWEEFVASHPAPPAGAAAPLEHRLVLQRGVLTMDGHALTGREIDTAWWRGFLLPAAAPEPGPALTRFVPGRTGLGLTDDLAALTDKMIAENEVAMRHHWGLWYDIRSDDHERTRRPDAEVWPPFFEQPWLRSGQGEAWDRLSRYDLSKYNPWYFSRLRQFADLGKAKGLVLINEMYFQHNILEDGAHWANFPWRSANNVNAVDFPEPPPYANDKWIFMAKPFYDLNHPVRRALHQAYIRQCLANLADEPNVLHTTGEEYTGPLAFMQFWFDVAAQWSTETGQHPLLTLSAPKDVQDAILADPVRSQLVSVIDLKYWWRTSKGIFAPGGGEDLSPRQSERKWRGGRPSSTDVAGMVAEYRHRFPEKAVITTLPGTNAWQLAAAGVSLSALPRTTSPTLLAAFARMQPADAPAGGNAGDFLLADPGRDYFFYSENGGHYIVALPGTPVSPQVRRIDFDTGEPASNADPLETSVTPRRTDASGAQILTLNLPAGQPAAIWITCDPEKEPEHFAIYPPGGNPRTGN